MKLENTLAYYDTEAITAVESFMMQTPVAERNFFWQFNSF
jgi:hypothetical protein